jgi:hypothetical protein
MVATIARVLATAIVVAMGIGIVAGLAPVGVGQILLACAGWALAYFGDDLAPLVGVATTPSTSHYVEPIIRGIGWLLLLAALGLFVVRAARLW